MPEGAVVLLADQDEGFLQSTARFLAENGYDCTCTQDGNAALGILRERRCQALIASTEVPGNDKLQLIRDVPRVARCVPVIVVAPCRSFDLAIRSLELGAVAYMVKPVDHQELLVRIRRSVQTYSAYRATCAAEEQLTSWTESARELASASRPAAGGASPLPLDAFVSLTLGNIAGALSDLGQVSKAAAHPEIARSACHLFDCPVKAALINGLKGTIAVLEETKSAFKSKQLGALRTELEALLEGVDGEGLAEGLSSESGSR